MCCKKHMHMLFSYGLLGRKVQGLLGTGADVAEAFGPGNHLSATRKCRDRTLRGEGKLWEGHE